MKKILIALTIAISCLGINKVSADTFELTYSNTMEYSCDYYVTDYDYLKELGYEDELQELYNLVIDKYKENYSSTYPYFYISVNILSSSNCNQISKFDKVGRIAMDLKMHSEIPIIDDWTFSAYDLSISASYIVENKTYELPVINSGGISGTSLYLIHDSLYNPFSYFVSNFDAINTEHTFTITGNDNFTVNPGDIIKPIFTYDNVFQGNYIEINLNDYAYVALALKDYNQKSFETIVYVKGQYCLTPVYNYGMTERKDILNGTQVDRCSPYYDSFTPIRTYILDNDLKNHSIYYLKSYDTSKDNYVKIDTTIFDVTLITDDNKDNPYVTIDGKKYPTIPYDQLTDTSTKSEDEGYVSGAVEEFTFSDIFTAPLEFLKDVWDAISSVFGLIKELFSLLPEPLPTFLIISFTLAIVLGLIKIIL